MLIRSENLPRSSSTQISVHYARVTTILLRIFLESSFTVDTHFVQHACKTSTKTVESAALCV